MADNGVKFVKDDGTKDITADDKDLQITTKYENLMVFAKGAISGTSQNLAHGLGFYPGFDAYIKVGSNYYLNYMGSDDIPTAMTAKGTISSDATYLYMTSTVAGALIYILYANPIIEALGNNFVPTAPVGMRFAQTPFTIGQGLGIEYVNSNFQMPLIVERKTISATTPAQYVPNNDIPVVWSSPTTTQAHSLGVPVHILAPDLQMGINQLKLYPGSVGSAGTSDDAFLELWVNSTGVSLKAYRRSVIGSGGLSFPETKPAETFTVDYLLTNIKLP